ncbi:MAG: CinA family protein, partial [Brevinema sp.]
CTAGLLSSSIANISGSSRVLLGGVISYHNDIKKSLLNVSPETLEHFGAVSFECVFEMAQGALKLSQADYIIAITGIAGPTGGSKDKPVGTVYTAILSKDNQGWAQKFIFSGTRSDIREKAVNAALRLLLSTEREDDFMDVALYDAREF